MTKEFKNMSLGEKIEHIWEYYKPHIFIPIFVIFAACSLFNSIVLHPLPDLYAGVAVYGSFIDDEKINDLIIKVSDLAVPEQLNEEVRFNCFYESESDSTVGVYMGDKFNMLLIAKELDIIISDKDNFHDLVYNGYIVNIDEIVSDEFMSKYSDIFYYDNNVQDSTMRPYGVSIKSSQILNNISNFDISDKYIGIVRHSERADRLQDIIEIIIN